ncbi:MAG: hypothetical protein RM338_21095 [Nostoc sp. DedQUE12a]|nr:hypothetical protein [Nostoc sp. DedQUE12a]
MTALVRQDNQPIAILIDWSRRSLVPTELRARVPYHTKGGATLYFIYVGCWYVLSLGRGY